MGPSNGRRVDPAPSDLALSRTPPRSVWAYQVGTSSSGCDSRLIFYERISLHAPVDVRREHLCRPSDSNNNFGTVRGRDLSSGYGASNADSAAFQYRRSTSAVCCDLSRDPTEGQAAGRLDQRNALHGAAGNPSVRGSRRIFRAHHPLLALGCAGIGLPIGGACSCWLGDRGAINDNCWGGPVVDLLFRQ